MNPLQGPTFFSQRNRAASSLSQVCGAESHCKTLSAAAAISVHAVMEWHERSDNRSCNVPRRAPTLRPLCERHGAYHRPKYNGDAIFEITKVVEKSACRRECAVKPDSRFAGDQQ